VLVAAEGVASRAIGREVGCTTGTVSKWRVRYAANRLAGLDETGNRGAEPKYTAETDKRILAVLDGPVPAGYARWTGPLIAAALGDVDVQYVWRFLRAHKIDLSARKSWCERNDPNFAAKAAEIVGLYLAPPENAIVICVDEKPSIQAIRTLIRQPRLRQMAREKPSLVPTIVSEVLRLESNVQRPVRIGRVARVIGGKTIQPGERVMLLLGAANRDPAAFPEPDDLRVDRRALPDVAFGEGHHFCLGASLARLEGRIALEQFLRLPPIEQAGHEKWYPGRAIRRLIRLPVRATGFTLAGVDRDS
jgi:transposase